MQSKTWHEKLLRTEAVFHVLAAAFVIKALFAPGPEAQSFMALAAGVAALGRSLPTEKVDNALSMPLTQSNDDPPEF